jgi:hypothetical protein
MFRIGLYGDESILMQADKSGPELVKTVVRFLKLLHIDYMLRCLL